MMTMNFTDILDQQQQEAKVARKRDTDFTDYSSKKKLAESGQIDDTIMAQINGLKNVFTLSLHKDGQYLALTTFKQKGKEKEYGFIVLDMKTMLCAPVASIKDAKNSIRELVSGTKVIETVTGAVEEEPAADENTEQEAPVQEETAASEQAEEAPVEDQEQKSAETETIPVMEDKKTPVRPSRRKK